MNFHIFQSPRCSRGKTLLLTGLVGWVPSALGQILRRFLYRSIFQALGKSVVIHTDVTVVDAQCLELADQVTLSRGVCMDARFPSHIALGAQTFLERDVYLTCVGQEDNIQVGQQVRLGRGVDLKTHGSGRTQIGDRTYIGPYTCISGYGSIKIGKDCLIASHTSIYAHNHLFSDPLRPIREQGFTAQGIVIEDDCWLGSGVKVLDGVTIGQGSVIGAGAVVTKDIPPYSVAVGVPARVISRRDRRKIYPLDSLILQEPSLCFDTHLNLHYEN